MSAINCKVSSSLPLDWRGVRPCKALVHFDLARTFFWGRPRGRNVFGRKSLMESILVISTLGRILFAVLLGDPLYSGREPSTTRDLLGLIGLDYRLYS